MHLPKDLGWYFFLGVPLIILLVITFVGLFIWVINVIGERIRNVDEREIELESKKTQVRNDCVSKLDALLNEMQEQKGWQNHPHSIWMITLCETLLAYLKNLPKADSPR